MNERAICISKRFVLLAGGLTLLVGLLDLALHAPLLAAGRDDLRIEQCCMIPPEGIPASPGPWIERWQQELGLNEKQIGELRALRDEQWKEHARKTLAHAQIDLGLTDEQISALQLLEEKHREQREAMRGKHREEIKGLQKSTGLSDEQIAVLGRLRGGHGGPWIGINPVHRGRGYGTLEWERGEFRERLSTILTGEQMEKLDELLKERRGDRRDEKRGERIGGEGRHLRRDCDRTDR